jgi:NAD(P)-dependent dehydrogenase (short-subunit alcohol dehydrogenase family)
MKCIGAVELFTSWVISQFGHLDGIINNACQTIRRPPQYYAHLLEYERESAAAALTDASPQPRLDVRGSADEAAAAADAGGGVAAVGLQPTAMVAVPATADLATNLPSFEVCQVAVLAGDRDDDPGSFPADTLDVNGQQIDLRKETSWLLKLGDVQTPELCEVMAVNSVAPFILNGKLRPLLKKSPHSAKFIVNVSAMEGKFYRFKTPAHPHTNMAKAALNMMTKTSATDYHTDGIFMTAVDTGWINDENPLEKAQQIAEDHDFQTPLDEIDAAARIVDPVLSGVADGGGPYGIFIKDYVKTEW